MAASGWNYITPYDGGAAASLAALHRRVFEQEFGSRGYASLEEVWADLGEDGTHTIMDVFNIVESTDAADGSGDDEDTYALRPVAPERVLHYFGTGQPTVEQFEAKLVEAHRALSTYPPAESLLDEDTLRWSGRYVILYTDGAPTHLGIFGSSGD